ncbi:MAG: Ig-like domain-containing protein, partial [Clostridia bacterium]|nr:Ig-like domain-containing protein [Clostridia bacterium]
MKTNFTKFRPLALILAIALLIGLVPFTALADEELDAAINAEGGLLEFVTEGDYPWVVATDDATGRTYAKSSNEGVNSSSSALSLDISLDEETNIRFDFIAAGEGSSTAWDKCIFAVDGEAVFTYGAHNTTWETYFGSIEAGEHTLTWTYTKDSSVNPTGDYFAIDNFMLNATIPTYELYIGRTQADMTNADDILGDGVFSYNAGTNTLYIDGDYHDEETAVTSYIEGLTVSISYDSEISSTGGNAFLLFAGTIFTGKGTLYATSEQAPAINLNARESFVEFYSAHAYLSGSAAISTGGAGNTLYIIYSGIEAEGEEQAVYGFDSIWVEGEIIVEPKDGSFGEDNVYVDDDPADYFLLEPATTDIYAICTYDYGNTYTGSFITFNTGDITSFDLIGDAPGAYAAAYAYGRILVLDTTGNYYIINIDNGETVEIDEAFDVDDYGTPTSMTYDYSSDTLYVVTSLGNDRYLLQLDPASAEVLDAESLGSYNAFGICADPDGILFLACGDGTVYLYDTYTGDLDDLAEVADIEAQPSYVQDICYDFDNDLIYWAFINSSTNGLYRISPKDGGYELLGKLGSRGAELTGMFTIPSEEPETPSEITDIAFAASEVTVHKGKSVKLGIAVTPFTAEGYEIDFSTEDEDIISVDENGVVTGLKVGIAEVKATVVGTEITDYCTVSVIPGPLVGFYFEEDPADEGWTFVDADEDGYNWGWNLDAAV